MCKGAKGMHFENYAKRINSVKDIEIFGQLLQEKQEQNRFVVKNNNMYLEKIKKKQSLHRLTIRGTTLATVLSPCPFSIRSFLSLWHIRKVKRKRLQITFLRIRKSFLWWKKMSFWNTIGSAFINTYCSRIQCFII